MMSERITEIEARMSALNSELDTADAERLKAIETEVNELNAERKAIADEAETRAEKREAIANEIIETRTMEKIETENEVKIMTMTELRSSKEYAEAYLNTIKTGDDTQMRSLLSTNAQSGGYVPVPTDLETEIKTAWDDCKIMSLIKKSAYKGNVKVGFEISADGAVVHLEGDNAPSEEVAILGVVEIKADNIKKWITVSDEALEGTTVDTIGYLYKEIAQRIVEKAESVLIGKITASPTSATSSACGVPALASNPAVDTILNALAMLSGQAKDVYIAMNRASYPAFRNLELNANYGIDVFEGLRDKIVFTDALPAYGTASTDDVYAIVGDFGYGAQANLPNGNDITIKVDELSLAEKDLVKIIGRQYVGMAVVADKCFVNVKKAAVEG